MKPVLAVLEFTTSSDPKREKKLDEALRLVEAGRRSVSKPDQVRTPPLLDASVVSMRTEAARDGEKAASCAGQESCPSIALQSRNAHV